MLQLWHIKHKYKHRTNNNHIVSIFQIPISSLILVKCYICVCCELILRSLSDYYWAGLW